MWMDGDTTPTTYLLFRYISLVHKLWPREQFRPFPTCVGVVREGGREMRECLQAGMDRLGWQPPLAFQFVPCIHPSIHSSIHSSIHPSIHPSIPPIHPNPIPLMLML